MTASPGRRLPVAVRAGGCVIEDSDGKRYLDACGGAMVMLLGHGHPRIVETLQRQAERIAFTYRFSFSNEPMMDLAERIARIAPGDLEWCFFNSSGSEANESALHLAVLYWELQGHAGKIALLLTDMVMPGGMNGTALAVELRKQRADLPVVFMTGYSPEVAGRELDGPERGSLIQKPASPRAILEAVQNALASPADSARRPSTGM